MSKIKLLVISLIIVGGFYQINLFFFHSVEDYVEHCIHNRVYLSALINSEADSTDILDMYLVGSTVLNRVESKDFPSTIDSVITQKTQYSGFDTERFVCTEKSDTVAARLLRGWNRDREVLYFYNSRAEDKIFLNKLKTSHKYICSTNAHVYFGDKK